VLATGTVLHLPPIPGLRRPGVFAIRKDYDHLDHLFEDLIPGVKRLPVVGGGFIGVEFADEVRKRGVAVTVIEHRRPKTTAGVLNATGIAIQARLSVHEPVSFQFGSHPRLTAPAHPIALCALDAMHQLSGNSSHVA
jgi:pyruvate/2-oxoglutarate dehydrogenase complex dihydrolipoamide dehydrogenase (E3) component